MAFFTNEQADNSTIINIVENLEDGVCVSMQCVIKQSNNHQQSFPITGVNCNSTLTEMRTAIKTALTTEVEWTPVSSTNLLENFSNTTMI